MPVPNAGKSTLPTPFAAATSNEDATVLCSVKTSPKQNGGRPITARRYVTPEGALIVTQEWAAGKVFTQKLVRV